jgi:hypothetical protein
MTSKQYLGLLFMVFTIQSNAQQFYIGAEGGFHQLKMSSLKSLNQAITDDLAFDAKVVSNYPGSPSLGLLTGFRLENRAIIGLRYNYSFTGSAISRRDYSGEYRLNSTVARNALGMLLEIPVCRLSNLTINITTELGGMGTHVDLEESLVLSNQSIVNKDKRYNGINIFFTPGISANYNWQGLLLCLKGGYELNFIKGSLNDKAGDKLELDGDDIYADWSGFYINVSAVFLLN